MSALFSQLLTVLNADVISTLAEAGYPALTDGAVLFSRLHTNEQSAPPRIVVVPRDPTFSLDCSWSSADRTGNSLDRKTAVVQPPIATEEASFSVECWGQSVPANDAGDYDIARALAHAVIASLRRRAKGNVQLGKGKYVEKGERTRCGRTLTFDFTLQTPVQSTLQPYSATNLYAPAGVTPVTIDYMIDPVTGLPTQGC